MIGLPQISTYGPYQGNYGTHCMRVDIGPLSIWYSYQTVIAFHLSGHPRVVIENLWGPTTGKHLNAIDGGRKSGRVDQETFDRLWREQVEAYFDPPAPEKPPEKLKAVWSDLYPPGQASAV